VQPTPIVTDVIQRKAKAHREYNGEHQGFVVFHCVSFQYDCWSSSAHAQRVDRFSPVSTCGWLEQHIVLNAVVDTEALATSTYP
jgi:hypothetical protein